MIPNQSTGSKRSLDRRLAGGLVILFEDRDIIVVNKPAGLLSIASGTERNRTAHRILSEYLRSRGEKRSAAVVHRLDRDTSGVMLFVKSARTKQILMENWDEFVTERRYAALAEGEIAENEGVINAPLGEDSRGRVAVTSGGRPALTRWKLLQRGRGYSLLSLELETGRHNQIRAHLSYLGCPVAGDKKYGAKTNPAGRLCLHAEKIAFFHPRDKKPGKRGPGAPMEFTVRVPYSFLKACEGQ